MYSLPCGVEETRMAGSISAVSKSMPPRLAPARRMPAIDGDVIGKDLHGDAPTPAPPYPPPESACAGCSAGRLGAAAPGAGASASLGSAISNTAPPSRLKALIVPPMSLTMP